MVSSRLSPLCPDDEDGDDDGDDDVDDDNDGENYVF